MLSKKFIKKYFNKKFKYSKYLRHFNLWLQIYIVLIANYVLPYKMLSKNKILFNKTKEFVKNQN